MVISVNLVCNDFFLPASDFISKSVNNKIHETLSNSFRSTINLRKSFVCWKKRQENGTGKRNKPLPQTINSQNNNIQQYSVAAQNTLGSPKNRTQCKSAAAAEQKKKKKKKNREPYQKIMADPNRLTSRKKTSQNDMHNFHDTRKQMVAISGNTCFRRIEPKLSYRNRAAGCRSLTDWFLGFSHRPRSCRKWISMFALAGFVMGVDIRPLDRWGWDLYGWVSYLRFRWVWCSANVIVYECMVARCVLCRCALAWGCFSGFNVAIIHLSNHTNTTTKPRTSHESLFLFQFQVIFIPATRHIPSLSFLNRFSCEPVVRVSTIPCGHVTHLYVSVIWKNFAVNSHQSSSFG